MPAVNAWAALQGMHGDGTWVGLLVGLLIGVPVLVIVLAREANEDKRWRDPRYR